MKVNIEGTARDITGGKVNIGGTWRDIINGWVNIDGTWREIGFKQDTIISIATSWVVLTDGKDPNNVIWKVTSSYPDSRYTTVAVNGFGNEVRVGDNIYNKETGALISSGVSDRSRYDRNGNLHFSDDIDASNNRYLIEAPATGYGPGQVVKKYNSSGNLVYSVNIENLDSKNYGIINLVSDEDGNAYVSFTGSSGGYSSNGHMKLSPNGLLVWRKESYNTTHGVGRLKMGADGLYAARSYGQASKISKSTGDFIWNRIVVKSTSSTYTVVPNTNGTAATSGSFEYHLVNASTGSTIHQYSDSIYTRIFNGESTAGSASTFPENW